MIRSIVGVVAAAMLLAAGPAQAAGIPDLGKRWEAAFNRKDAAAVAALHTNNAVWITPAGIMRGRAAILKGVEARLKAGFHAMSIHVLGGGAQGNMAWAIAEWHALNRANRPISGYGSSVYVRVGGVWKIREHTSLGKAPPPKPSQTSGK